MTWIQTYTGRKFYPLDPNPEDVCIEDIAHALSLKCRFNGHCKQFYSVAEHSVRVSNLASQFVTPQCSARTALLGLLHDAGEAYLPDICRPIKDNILVSHRRCRSFFRAVEGYLLDAILSGLGVEHPSTSVAATIEHADMVLLATEARDLMGDPPQKWQIPDETLEERIVPWSPSHAEDHFLMLYEMLREAGDAQ